MFTFKVHYITIEGGKAYTYVQADHASEASNIVEEDTPDLQEITLIEQL